MCIKSVQSYLVGAVILLSSLNVNAMSIYVVGDSLSDTGNIFYALGGATTNPPYTELIPSAAYSSRRLSNDPIWAERLAANLDFDLQASLIGGTGYAYGGARTGALTGIVPSGIPTLIEQARTIVDLSGSLSADDLFVVWGGGNDLRDAASTGNASQAAVIVQESLFNISSTITSLANEGASRFLVPNLPDLGLTPAVQLAGQPAVGFISQLTENFNDTLASTVLPGLELDLDIDIIDLDIEALIDEIIFDPASFGFTNVTDACIQIGGDACSNPEDYLFWDGIHPTAAAHLIIGDTAYASIVPIPATLPFLLLQFQCLGFTLAINKAVKSSLLTL